MLHFMHDPRIAVLIPAYNEELVIAGTIEALFRANCSRHDIYIIDDRSSDNTAEIARSLGVNVYTVPENGGKARAQTSGLQHFRLCEGPLAYEWVIFLDGDSKVGPEFMTAMREAAITDPTVALYVGQVKSVRADHLYSASRTAEYAHGHDLIKQGQHNFGVIFVSPGCASMYKTEMLKHLHIDHETLAEDMDLTMQVHRRGGKVHYVDAAHVHTQDPNNFKDYFKQIQRWNRGFWQVILKHRVFSPFTKKQRVDWYMIFITIDCMLCNRLVWMTGIGWLFNWNLKAFVFGIAIDMAFTLAVAIYTSIKTKRLDVLIKAPIYFWLRPMADYVNVKTFVEIILFRKKLLAWNKVARYEFNDHLGTQRN